LGACAPCKIARGLFHVFELDVGRRALDVAPDANPLADYDHNMSKSKYDVLSQELDTRLGQGFGVASNGD
jgi:hypothetical protein